ncbi:MAG: RidA family protein [Anaerovorax sp.]|nr:RidA family protein [Anaerovorax sp.]
MSKEKTEICSTEVPAAVGAYSQAIATDHYVFTSGQLPLDSRTCLMPESPKEQAKQSLKNIKNIIESSDLTMDDVVKTTVLLTDIKDFSDVNEVYETYFTKPYPARSCFAVAALPKGAKVEIEVIARR